MTSSLFSLSSQAFLLEQIEETYNVDFLLALYQNKSPLRPFCSIFKFLVGPLGIVGSLSAQTLTAAARLPAVRV